MEFRQQKSIKMNGWTFVDFPVLCTEQDYQEARQEIKEKLSKNQNILAVLEFGQISYPGISDIDHYIIFKKEADKMHVPNNPPLSSKTKYLMYHKGLIISEELYDRVLFLDPWSTYVYKDFHHVPIFDKKGYSFKSLNLNPQEKFFLDIDYIIQLTNGILNLLPTYLDKKISVRSLLETIKDCVFIIIRVNNFSNQKMSTDYIEKIKQIEKNWFIKKLEDSLIELPFLLEDALRICFQALYLINIYLSDKVKFISNQKINFKKNGFFRKTDLDDKAKNMYVCNYGISRVYTDYNFSPEDLFKISLEACRLSKEKMKLLKNKIKIVPIVLPLFISMPIVQISLTHGLLSQRLRKDVFTNCDFIPFISSPVLQERANYAEEITTIYNQKRVLNSEGKGYILYNNEFKYDFKLEKIKRKLLIEIKKNIFLKTINTAIKIFFKGNEK